MNLLECDHNGIGMVTCDRSHEAGVQCEGTLHENNALAWSSITFVLDSQGTLFT